MHTMAKQMIHAPLHLFTIDDALTVGMCEAMIADSEGRGYDAAPVTTERGPVMRPDIRNNTRVMVDDADLAARLWARIRVFMPDDVDGWTPIGLNERFRYYRYDPGQRFEWHFDGRFVRDANERSVLTLMFYLNDGFEGGETRFKPRGATPITVAPRRGAALLFHHHVLHTGAEVRRGRKYVLRTDVMGSSPRQS